MQYDIKLEIESRLKNGFLMDVILSRANYKFATFSDVTVS